MPSASAPRWSRSPKASWWCATRSVRADAPDPDRFWVVQDNPALSGTDIRNPEQNFDQQFGNQPVVRFKFTDRGREAFQEITRAIAQRGRDNAFRAPDPQHFAIVLDDELVSAPSIDYVEYPDGIDGRTGAEISGSFTIDSAQDLAEILKIGALPVRLELVSRSQVSASLGQQALDRGLLAGLAGFAIVVLFLLVFYRVLGVIASVAMGIYGLYLYAIVELIPIVLTLPGIAGMILTLGVAADANIVIFERVKEEIRAGRSVGAAISAGYKKGRDGDPGRQHRHDPGRLHPVRAGDLGGAGVCAHARGRGDRVVVHRRAGDPGDPVRVAWHASAAFAGGARGA